MGDPNAQPERLRQPKPGSDVGWMPGPQCRPHILDLAELEQGTRDALHGGHATFTTCGIDTWEWDWGDGLGFLGQNPGSHNYGAGGDYPVTLTVTNAAGTITTGAVIIHVKP